MDGRHFDHIATLLAGARPRRGLVRLALVGGIAAVARLLNPRQVTAVTCQVDTECQPCESCFRNNCSALACNNPTTCSTGGCDPATPHQCVTPAPQNEGAPCATDSVCSNGECCPIGTTNCGAGCVDFQTDPNNCGTCGNTCGADETCCSGECLDSLTDTQHCGNCGNSCGASQSCQNGQCVAAPAPPAPPPPILASPNKRNRRRNKKRKKGKAKRTGRER